MSKSKKVKQAELAKRKAKQKKIAITSVVAGLLAAVAVVVAIVIAEQSKPPPPEPIIEFDAYKLGEQEIRLYQDGTFFANLVHGVVKEGTYDSITKGLEMEITFKYDEKEEQGKLTGKTLTIPENWDDRCQHGIEFEGEELEFDLDALLEQQQQQQPPPDAHGHGDGCC